MDFKIDIKIFLVLFLFLIFKQLEMYILFMIFVIIHEFFHLLTGIILGYKIKSLKIEILGISLGFHENINKYNNIRKIIILMMGPISNIIIALIFDFLKLPKIVYVNLVIAIFNLLPVYPLDGGQILNRILGIIYGNIEAYKITNWVNTMIMSLITAIASIAILYVKNMSIVIIVLFLWCLVIKENKKIKEINKYFKYVHKLDKKGHYNI